jgi:hypothetical protein
VPLSKVAWFSRLDEAVDSSTARKVVITTERSETHGRNHRSTGRRSFDVRHRKTQPRVCHHRFDNPPKNGPAPVQCLFGEKQCSHSVSFRTFRGSKSSGFAAMRASLRACGERVKPFSSLRTSRAWIATGTVVVCAGIRASDNASAVTPFRLNVAVQSPPGWLSSLQSKGRPRAANGSDRRNASGRRNASSQS